MRHRAPPSPRWPSLATWWLVFLSVVSLSWTAAAVASPVRELPRLLSSSKYQSLRSHETQESSSCIPETRIRGSEFRGDGSHQENRRLKLELIGFFEFAYGRKASDGLELSRDPIGFQGGLNLYAYVENNPINQRDPLGLDAMGAGSPFRFPAIPPPKIPFTSGVKNNATCTRYAFNDPAKGRQNPAYEIFDNKGSDTAAHLRKMLHDRYDLDYADANDPTPAGYWKIAVVKQNADEGWDWHFYRQEADGLWTHKLGENPVASRDAAGRLIVNPETVTRDPDRNKGYGDFGGYLFVPHDFNIDHWAESYR